MEKGDRVQLTDSVAKVHQRNLRGASIRNHLDWRKRQGTITVVGKHIITVQWDDRKTLDHWPEKALRLV